MAVTTEPIQRAVARVVTTPGAQPGFIGAGHTAVEVLDAHDIAGNDPFVLLMDDRLDMPDRRKIGGAHPHAGLETVTLVLEGDLHDRDEGPMSAGDAAWMSAGRGVIHNESVETAGRSRILQLWVRLPAADRGTAPSFEIIRGSDLPVRREGGAELRLYSGTSGGLRSPTRNHAPVTMADIRLQPGASISQELPASYQGFFYVLDGVVRVGDREIRAGQVGWLDQPAATGESILHVRAPEGPARLVLYAGEPQREPLVHHGPFVAGSPQEIARLFREFRSGLFEPLSRVARRQAAAT